MTRICSSSHTHTFKGEGEGQVPIGDFSRWLMGHHTFANLHGTFRGGPVVGSVAPGQHGWLTGKNREAFDDMADVIDYVIYSYNTPIAWHETGQDQWVLVSDKFSRATTNHQGAVLFALVDASVHPFIVKTDKLSVVKVKAHTRRVGKS